MKVCIHMRQGISPDLEDGNLRGEARWERQVLAAMMENPEVTDVYTSGAVWPTGGPKYRGMVNQSSAPQCVLFLHDWRQSIIDQFHFKAVLVNIFSGPWKEQRSAIKKTAERYGDKLLFTLSYEVMEITHPDYLSSFIPRKNIQFISIPGASKVIEGSNFDKKTLLWPYRIIFMDQVYQTKAIIWALQKLMEDSSMKLKIATSWNTKSEPKDVSDGKAFNLPTDITTYFWNRPETQPYIAVKDQVKLFYSLTHKQILSLYAESKLVLPHYRYFGGPPIEAAMHGVPFVGNSANGAFSRYDKYVWTSDEDKHIEIMEKLYKDREYYDQTAENYKNYVKDNFTYAAFNRKVNSILKERGLV